MRILLIKGLSQYDATRLFIEDAAAAFQRAGWDAVVVDVEKADRELDYLGQVVAGQRFDLAYSIGLFGERRDTAGRSLAEIVGAPHVVQYVDYPLSHYFRLNDTPAATVLLTVDPTHADAVRSVYGEGRFAHVAFSPHAALGEPHASEGDPEQFLAARDIPILFPGSFYKPGPPMWEQLPPATRKVFEAAVEIALGQEFIPALEAFDQALAQYGGHLAPAARADFRVNAFAVHERVRQHRRFELLKAAARARLPVQVVGGGYDRDLYRFKNVTHLGAQSLDEVIALMRRSRVVLNVNANFGRGSHERPLTAMVAGAVAASDASSFYADNFGPEAMVQFEWMRLDDGLQALAALLDDPQRMVAIARAGHAKAVAGHRWDSRVAGIVAAAQAARAA